MKLIAFVSLEDPFWAGIIHEEAQKGPILETLLRHQFDSLLLLHSPGTAAAADRVCKEIPPEIKVQKLLLKSAPEEGLKNLTQELLQNKELLGKYSEAAILNSGSPQERATLWILKYEGILKGNFIECSRRAPQVDFHATPSAEVLKVCETKKKFEDDETDVATLPWDAVAKKVGCIGKSARFVRTLEEAAMLATHPTPILLIGETGSGKEVLAKFIHALSPRAEQPLVTINCAALPESLAESILFGHEKGSFTGAHKRQKGKFELADGGTLFLDEIGELSLANQAKLLRVLEEKCVDALGSDAPVSINVRVVAATNRNLAQEVARGNFREDLYYRLRSGEIHIPPLRERVGDVPLIAMHLLNHFNASLLTPKQLSRETLKFLETLPWPGNVRDLMNTLERAALLCPRVVIEPSDFKVDQNKPSSNVADYAHTNSHLPTVHPGFSLDDYLDNMRLQIVERTLLQTCGNQREAAGLLGISQSSISRTLRESGSVKASAKA